MNKSDFLIIGSGIAGLSYALKIAQYYPKHKITIVTKGERSDSNTKYAQGGIATVSDFDKDSFEEHVTDTLKAGDGLCDESIVRMVVKQGPQRLKELINWGVVFDQDNENKYDLAMEGGHSHHRVLHYKDITGREIERALLSCIESTNNIELLENHYAVDFITQHQVYKEKTDLDSGVVCYGAYVFDKKEDTVKTFVAKITMLASGGSGQVYRTTTNPKVATSDGIGMAYRAKAVVRNLEFIQFHPTALYDTKSTNKGVTFLISEAVRGFGAKLCNRKNEYFMSKYDPMADLASRDIVARAIDSELKQEGEDYLYLDCRHIDYDEFINHFPNINEKCKSIGIDIRKDMIPVAPANHYLCGGIKTDEHGRTSIDNLYACGECTSTGLHGANRLASNSLLEAIVFSHNSYKNTIEVFENIVIPDVIPVWNDDNTFENKEKVLITHDRKTLQNIMSDYVGIVRSDRMLKIAEDRIGFLYKQNEILYKNSKLTEDICELRNMITTGYLITKFSIERTQNKGGFYNIDLDKAKK
ncbi:MAG: L-aspartate oxidase [Flavobacteriaceae bacterium]|nr:L-aspartate oxidase [Flavobacteriaceae bacterium]